MLFSFTKGVSIQSSLDFYELSLRTYNRAVAEGGSSITERKYAIGFKRFRFKQEQLDEVKKILDDILPKQSGRDWRYQDQTNNKIYETYSAEVLDGQPVSKKFFIYTILAKEKIRHSKKIKFCPICEEHEAGNRTPDVVRHHELIPIQRGQYSLTKKNIGNGTTPKTALVTQDFTQIQFEGGFVQDLIICIYTHGNGKDGLNRLYRHFVGNTGEKNDIFCYWCLESSFGREKFCWNGKCQYLV